MLQSKHDHQGGCHPVLTNLYDLILFNRKLPDDYSPHEVKEAIEVLGGMQPLNIFLRWTWKYTSFETLENYFPQDKKWHFVHRQEIDRMQRMLSLLRRTLTDLVMAIEGTIIMSDDLKEVLDNMFDAKVCVATTDVLGKSCSILKKQVPEKWTKISWRSSTLGFWWEEIKLSPKQLIDGFPNHRPQVHGASWEEQSVPHLVLHWQTHRFLDDRFLQPPGGVFRDIGGIFWRSWWQFWGSLFRHCGNVQGFLTAMRQEVTRAHRGWALDRCFDFLQTNSARILTFALPK